MLPPVPDIIVHNPVPTAGAFPASVVLVNPHIADPVWSDPASAVVGNAVIVTVASPVCGCELGVASLTLTSEYMYIPSDPVGTETVTVFSPVRVETVRSDPPFIL